MLGGCDANLHFVSSLRPRRGDYPLSPEAEGGVEGTPGGFRAGVRGKG